MDKKWFHRLMRKYVSGSINDDEFKGKIKSRQHRYVAWDMFKSDLWYYIKTDVMKWLVCVPVLGFVLIVADLYYIIRYGERLSSVELDGSHVSYPIGAVIQALSLILLFSLFR